MPTIFCLTLLPLAAAAALGCGLETVRSERMLIWLPSLLIVGAMLTARRRRCAP